MSTTVVINSANRRYLLLRNHGLFEKATKVTDRDPPIGDNVKWVVYQRVLMSLPPYLFFYSFLEGIHVE